ncbi:MAG: hypothetical protein OEX98_07375 [Nitrosopumilus sp.]|nr:hypothetical protein [Nitrosopumilus sp.]
MTPRKIIGIIGIIATVILVTFVFVPTNEFSGISSHNPESPSPIMVYENSDDMLIGLEIIPVGCNKTESGLNESEFQISNTSDNDYKVRVGISFTDNDAVLYEKETGITVHAGKTINQSHLSDKPYDNPICVVQIKDWSKI